MLFDVTKSGSCGVSNRNKVCPVSKMVQTTNKFQFIIAEIERLTKDGVLGFYTHFEVTEVFAHQKGCAVPVNVFSLFVAEDRGSDPCYDPVFLGSHIKLKGLNNWNFGVIRYLRTISGVLDGLENYQKTSKWCMSGKLMNVDDLETTPTQFVPADTTVVAPWNNVLKNNFWNGSYVVELANYEKTSLKPLFENPPLLQDLSNHIQRVAPLRIASLSDRLGHIAFQFPITAVVASFAQQRVSGDVVATLAWHPTASPRMLRATIDMQEDDVVTGFGSAVIGNGSTIIKTSSGQGRQRAILWDEQNEVLLGATGSTAFINTIVTNMQVVEPEPRVFTIPGKNQGQKPVRIGLSRSNKFVVGDDQEKQQKWINRRIYTDEADRLARERRFIQYRPKGSKVDAHEAALTDLHFLLRKYGEEAAWLWDPYLSAKDILQTLFYCPHFGSDLRALTGGKVPNECSDTHSAQNKQAGFCKAQQEVFTNSQTNWHGVRLEYRVRSDDAGWPFHDRFLIFPVKDGGAHVWSLGTSVNSFGSIHHILQKVGDGQLVMDAFVELWNQLDQPQHLIMKRP